MHLIAWTGRWAAMEEYESGMGRKERRTERGEGDCSCSWGISNANVKQFAYFSM